MVQKLEQEGCYPGSLKSIILTHGDIDHTMNAGDSLAQYGFEGEVIHLPGHTAGSIGILFENGELIAGDTFTNMKKPSTALNAYNFKELKKCVKKLKDKKITKIYPGHGEPFQANLLGFVK